LIKGEVEWGAPRGVRQAQRRLLSLVPNYSIDSTTLALRLR